ncbi:ankyrin repeat domain-containing protein 34B [Betta splendens]|uniref:Ankyrin repeat domain-containing protein 34B n=1 Tax=Betta splendens TaxID=158456 RepID=A0A6P7P698_BETSP|nr:ankyrin repeat domain-containing protein 34B [Betta splendens]
MEPEGSSCEGPMDSGNPLLRAVFLRRLRLTRLLLDGGAYINESNSQGQTPLMVACRTQHTDSQSASRVKLVQFLLDKGADPNIQDKKGLSALMHACREQAGPEVVSLLLRSGADVSLEDRSGTSALVYAVMAADWRVLKLLLDACKAKGKEVIIITAEKFPCGKLQAKQYLSMAPPAPLHPADKVAPAPASPSDIQLITSPQGASSSLHPPKPVFSFKEAQSHPCSPSRLLQQPLLRLNSEPWLKVPVSLLKPSSEPEDLPSVGTLWCEGAESDDSAGLLSSHSASHPNLHSDNLLPESRAGVMTSSSLRSIIQRRKLGPDIYSSDPQLAVEPSLPADGRRLAPIRCSRDSLLSAGRSRRVLSGYERRGSGAFLLELGSQARPRSLPPLALGSTNAPALHSAGRVLAEKESGLKHFTPCAPPGQPKERTRTMLLRRHSMQIEQFKSPA